jgi:cellulose synthase/poly-beta-1,6-N-acetylglucosamine synthase-like glycosyltransferase
MKCVRSIVEKTSYAHYEVVIVDSGRMSAAAGSELVGVRPSQITVVEAGSSEPSAMMNAGVRLARGEHLVFLHDDIEVIGDDWLGAMLEYSQQREIGAVGAKLYDRDGRLQHIGIILGINGSAGRVFRGHAKDHPGYYGGAWVIRNYSAVSGACLMTRRAVFEEVGGFGKHFPARFVDIDYCLRADARGYRTVFTPFAELRHHEMGPLDNYSSRPSDDDIRALNARWPAKLENDPFYNPNLSRDGTDYQLRS